MAEPKKYAIPKERIRQLVTHPGGCMATDRIMVDGEAIGYMYREEPDGEMDNGWRFASWPADRCSDRYVSPRPDHVGLRG